MWILIRLIAAAVGFYLRTRTRTYANTGGRESFADGTPFKIVQKTHKGTTHWTEFVFELELPCVFKLTKERWYDKIFKFLGVAVEIQTGDQKFDEAIYVASDHPEFARALRSTAGVRDLVLSLTTPEFRFIGFDGHCLKIRYKGDQKENTDLQYESAQLLKQCLTTRPLLHGQFADPYFKRALLIEAMIWSIAGYACGGFADFMWRRHTIYLENHEILMLGLKFGLGLCGAILTIVFLLLTGSSRSHRLLLESVFVLTLSLPFAGINMAMDLNQSFDRTPPISGYVNVLSSEQVQHRGRRGRTYYTYHLSSAPAGGDPIHLPARLSVPSAVFNSTSQGATIPVVMRNGWFEVPFIESINGIDL